MKNEMNFSQKMESLKNDLVGAWDFANDENAFAGTGIPVSDWTLSLDTENLAFLKALWLTVDGSYSLNSLAHSIRKGKQLIGLN